jgi:hypothetical protein
MPVAFSNAGNSLAVEEFAKQPEVAPGRGDIALMQRGFAAAQLVIAFVVLFD